MTPVEVDIQDALADGDYGAQLLICYKYLPQFLDDYDDDEDDEYEEYEPKPLPPLPDKSPFPPNLRKPDVPSPRATNKVLFTTPQNYLFSVSQVRWFDLIDFEKNLLTVQQARKGGGEGIVLERTHAEPPKPVPEQIKVSSSGYCTT